MCIRDRVLGVTHESRFEDLVRYDIRPAMFRYEEAGKLSETAVKNGARANIHLAVDTGCLLYTSRCV